jgi:ABC-2 type transport system ATP-binding protein
VLLTIPGVNSIEPVTDNKFIIHYRVSEDPCQQIAETIITKGWELQELSPIKKSLEDIFIALTKTSDS